MNSAEYINTVLVVDDSAMIVNVLGFMIKKAGYTILSAEDGRSALELFDGREIDLVITDLNMPVMDGLELIAEIRLNAHYKYLPIILFSAPSQDDAEDVLRQSGATMLFDKTNIKEKMIPAIKKMLG